jgi:hypothetical protein
VSSNRSFLAAKSGSGLLLAEFGQHNTKKKEKQEERKTRRKEKESLPSENTRKADISGGTLKFQLSKTHDRIPRCDQTARFSAPRAEL